MMTDERAIYMEIRKFTFIFTIIAMAVMQVWKGNFSTYGVGVLIGSLTGLMGFQMIIHYVNKLGEHSKNITFGSYRAYVQRYVLYFLILGVSVLKGVNIFALLVGMLCQKGAILWYTYYHRKEDA